MVVIEAGERGVRACEKLKKVHVSSPFVLFFCICHYIPVPAKREGEKMPLPRRAARSVKYAQKQRKKSWKLPGAFRLTFFPEIIKIVA